MTPLSTFVRSLFSSTNPVVHLLSLSDVELTRRGFDRDALARSYVLGLANH